MKLFKGWLLCILNLSHVGLLSPDVRWFNTAMCQHQGSVYMCVCVFVCVSVCVCVWAAHIHAKYRDYRPQPLSFLSASTERHWAERIMRQAAFVRAGLTHRTYRHFESSPCLAGFDAIFPTAGWRVRVALQSLFSFQAHADSGSQGRLTGCVIRPISLGLKWRVRMPPFPPSPPSKTLEEGRGKGGKLLSVFGQLVILPQSSSWACKVFISNVRPQRLAMLICRRVPL